MPTANLQIPFCCLSKFLILVLCSFANAQIPEKKSGVDEEEALVERWYKAYDEIIDSIQVGQSSLPSDGTSNSPRVELKKETILSINNADFGAKHGRVYLWTENGRPVVLSEIKSANDGTLYGTRQVRRVAYEFNSLCQNAVTAARNDKVFWNCTEPGVKWQNDLEESIPSASRTARLTQMRSIARDIEVGNLRLLTTPIYRYPIEMPDVTDGAIFAFATGTEPHLYLLIEVRQNKWYLSCSRSRVGKISVMKGTRIIESFDYEFDQNIFQMKPFYEKYTAERRLANDPNTIVLHAWANQ